MNWKAYISWMLTQLAATTSEADMDAFEKRNADMAILCGISDEAIDLFDDQLREMVKLDSQYFAAKAGNDWAALRNILTRYIQLIQAEFEKLGLL